MGNFKYYTPTKVLFGRGQEEKVGKLAKEFGATKVLVHYGLGSVVKSGLLDLVKAKLDEEGIEHIELGGVVPNPRVSLVREGVELAKKEKIDMVIAVGGGSVIDSAKAICYGALVDFDVWDFYIRKAKPEASLPLGAVLTLSATGSEMSDSSVISNDEGQIKRGINSDLCKLRSA